MIINSLIKQGSKILKKQNIDSHQIDAELLLSKAIRKDRVFLLTNDENKVLPKETSNYLNFILRRKQHEPLSYITKRKEFWSLDFNVSNNVLIPRPETEIIVEQVVRRFKGKGSLNILDIGTGSGCILLSILNELKLKLSAQEEFESRLKIDAILRAEKEKKESHNPIELGMSITQVEDIMGSPSEIVSNGLERRDQLWIYRYENGTEVYLTFTNYKLFRIEED